MISSRELGERIAAARKRRGLTQADLAESLGLGRTTLVAVEQGKRRPSEEELVAIAETLEVSLHELVRPLAVRAEASPRFRVAPTAGVEKEVLEEAVARLEDLAGRYVELERVHGLDRIPGPLETLPSYRCPGPGEGLDPERAAGHAARTVSDLLDLGDAPIVGLVELLDVEVGLRVFHVELPPAIAAIFLWGEEIGGCVGLNRLQPRAHRRWSLAHELGHFLRDRESGEVLPREGHARKDASEVFAEVFAKELLMPAGGIRRRFEDLARAQGGRFSVGDVLRLAQAYRVSFRDMLGRLQELRLLPRGTADPATAGSFEVRDEEPAPRWDAAGGEPPQTFPKRYVQLAVGAYQRDLISETELARYLECDRLTARQIVRREGGDPEGEGPLAGLELSKDLLGEPEG